jgi:hypothetical protein
MNPKIASISLIIASLAAASPAHAGFADGLAGGIAGGIISGAINAATHPLALTQDKSSVLAFFEDYFKRTTPQNSLADSSLFMEVQIGAYNYLVAKITENTEIGTVVKGFVIDLKNEYMTVLEPNVYAEFMRTGNIQLLGV